ncbi:MAG: hypothetical protein DME04_24445 [Candidatus Rokuibacteriota bacterium]|nr:MAG: hypothetical protein DME04_24445 [Candidatus Rokubacteria bacterium]
MKLTRRTALTLAGLAALGITVPACRQMLRQMLFSPDATPAAAPLPADNPFRAGGRSLVAIVHGDDPAAMVRRAVELIGGFDRLDLRGRRTLVKPNVVSGSPPPTTTDPRVVHSVLELARTAGAGSLAVGEMSAVLSLPSRPHLVQTGIARVATEVGAMLLAFDEGDWVEVRPPAAEYATSVYVAKAVHEAERLISVPVIKTHRNASFSCALKNTVGCVHGKNKPWAYGGAAWEPVVAELNLAVRPHLYVVDGLQSMVAGGPWSGESVRTNVILASGDPVAMDVVVLGLLKSAGRWELVIGKDVWEQRQIRRAVALGLGARGPADVALVAEDLTPEDRGFRELLDSVRREVGLVRA